MDKVIEVLTYGRCSTDEQETSLPIQRAEFDQHMKQDWLKAALGGLPMVVKDYEDEGYSASKKTVVRPDFEKLLKDIATIHSGKPLIVLNSSRFSRRGGLGTASNLETLRQNNVKLVVLQDRKVFDLNEEMDALMLFIKGGQDSKYSKDLSANTLRGRLHKVKEGQSTVSITPYGLAKLVLPKHGEQYVIPRGSDRKKGEDDQQFLVKGDALEAETVLGIFTTFATVDTSYKAIARNLNNHANPLVSKGPIGKGWNDCTIKAILTNEHYIGMTFLGKKSRGETHYHVEDGLVVSGQKSQSIYNRFSTAKTGQEGLISSELWQAVANKIQRVKEANSKPKATKDGEGYVLTGVLRCGHCGGTMNGHREKGGIRYSCRTTNRNSSVGCPCGNLPEEEILPSILDQIDMDVKRQWQQLQDQPTVDTATDDTMKKLETRIAEIRHGQDSIKAKLAKMPMLAECLLDTFATLQQEREGLETTLVKAKTVDTDSMKTAMARWNEMVKPMLVPIKTDDQPFPLICHLAMIDEECHERLINTTLVRPSVLREALHGIGAKCQVWWTANPVQNSRRKWVVATTKLTASIKGECVNVQGSA